MLENWMIINRRKRHINLIVQNDRINSSNTKTVYFEIVYNEPKRVHNVQNQINCIRVSSSKSFKQICSFKWMLLYVFYLYI